MAGRPEASWLAVGRVRRPHGIHGEVTVEILTDFPDRLVPGTAVGMGHEKPESERVVHTVRTHKGEWLLGFEGIETRDDVEPWRGLYLFLPEQERSSLPENYYYEHELVGCRCVTASGEELGEVTALQDGPGAALLVVRTPRGEAMAPFRSPTVVRVDLAAREVVLDPPRGLFDGDAL